MKNDVEPRTDVAKALGGDGESLELFTRNVRKFHARFCEAMNGNFDYTLRLEVHGNKGVLIHCRVYGDDFDRPHGVEKEVESRSRQKLGGR